ncbi:MAG: MFS transporter [bacterium]|nr:MFS transporter [bacterium]
MRLRLSTFWFLYLGGFGIFFPYYSLYLDEALGLSGTQIGVVMAMIPLVSLIVQPLWGHLADRTGSRPAVLAGLATAAAIAYLLLSGAGGFSSAWLGTAALAIFATTVLPLVTAVSMAAVRTRTHSYGFIRMWGTAGFLVTVVLFPLVLKHLEAAPLAGALPWHGLAWIFPATALLSLMAAGVALLLPRTEAVVVRAESGAGRQLLRHPPVVRLVFLVFAVHLFMQGPINLFPLYIVDRGGDVESIGRMWIFMLLLEIPLIGFTGHTLRRLGARGLLTVGVVAEGVRWGICAMTTNMALIAAVQLLHGVGIAGIMVGAPLYLEQAVPERLRATGQAVISAAGFGAGAAVSNAGAGWLLEHLGASAPYAVAGLGCLVLGLLVVPVLPVPRRPSS